MYNILNGEQRCKFSYKKSDLPIDICKDGCYYNLAFDESNAKYARVVELADSLDSGSSAHSGRAGSSPASRTKTKTATERLRFFVLVGGVTCLNPINKGSPNSLHRLFGEKAKAS